MVMSTGEYNHKSSFFSQKQSFRRKDGKCISRVMHISPSRAHESLNHSSILKEFQHVKGKRSSLNWTLATFDPSDGKIADIYNQMDKRLLWETSVKHDKVTKAT